MAVRAGGIRTPGGYLFELSGGNLCLDFINTLDGRPRDPRETLLSWSDLIDWGLQAGVLTAAEGRRLRAEGARGPAEARRALARARRLRETLHGVLCAAIAGRRPPDATLAAFNAALRAALARLRLVPGGAARRWSWTVEGNGLDRLLPSIVDSAAGLLAGDNLDRVRECGSETCGWLFLDASRSGTRRWCDMSICGNRDKARRHYRRLRKGGRPGR